jgi:enediyne biosynthesis protein E4
VIGNIGENFYLRPDSAHPAKMWLNDFDLNGTVDQFRTQTIHGKDIPLFVRRDLTEQFPSLKKENLKNNDYANKSIQQLFGKEIIDRSTVEQFNYCSSIIAINDGTGRFTIRKLPPVIQLSSANAITVADINHDNRPDLVIGGNNFNFPPQFGRLDASFGDVLLNRGGGKFETMNAQESGLDLRGEVRDIKLIKGKRKKYIIIAINDQIPALYQLQN